MWPRPSISATSTSSRVGGVTTDEFVRVMVTNALSPKRVVEALQDAVPSTGLIGVMSSDQGSITNNETGMREVYRSSKAALNQLMRSFAVRSLAGRIGVEPLWRTVDRVVGELLQLRAEKIGSTTWIDRRGTKVLSSDFPLL